jgi:hypothetical protein
MHFKMHIEVIHSHAIFPAILAGDVVLQVGVLPLPVAPCISF